MRVRMEPGIDRSPGASLAAGDLRVRVLVLGCMSGVLLWLPMGFYGLVPSTGLLTLVALVPVLALPVAGPWRALAAFTAGITWSAPQFLAFAPTSLALALVAPLVHAGTLGITFGVSSWFARRLGWTEAGAALGAAGIWLAMSLLLDELGFPQTPLTVGLVTFSALPALASRIVGVPGLDALAILFSAGVLQLVRARWRLLAITSVVWSASCFVAWNWPTEGLEEVSVHVVQPTIRTEDFQASGWSLGTRLSVTHRLDSLTAEAAKRPAGLIVWPEGGTGVPDVQVGDRRESISRTLKGSDAALIVATTIVGSRGRYAGAALIHDDRIHDITYKSHPVPIAEHDVRRREARPLDTRFGKVGVLICYDSMFASAVRSLGERGSEYLVLTTNDSSFGHSSALYKHLATTRLRALSYGLPLVVASNMGPSGFYDSSGREIGSAEFAERGVFSAVVERTAAFPPSYHFARWLWLLAVALLLVSIVTARNKGEAREATALRIKLRWVVVLSAWAVVLSVCAAVLGLSIEIGAQYLRDPSALREVSERARALIARTQGEFDGFGPAFRQSSQQTCGAAALAAALTHLGQLSTEEELRRRCRLPLGLVSAKQLTECASAAGMVAQGFQADWRWLTELGPDVAILHLDSEHFVALLGTEDDIAIVVDPKQGGVLTVPREQLESAWTGRAIRLSYKNPFM